MDRRRLEEAFLLLGSIEVIQKYNLTSIPSLPCDRNAMAEIVTKEFSEAFVTRWGGKCKHSIYMILVPLCACNIALINQM